MSGFHHCTSSVSNPFQIVMRLSKPDKDDPTKRRHFEISIDSPFHILSCRANQANTALPAYSSPDLEEGSTQMTDCGCPGAPRRRISPLTVPTLGMLQSQPSFEPGLPPNLARPVAAHIGGNAALQRPIHMLRAPSFNPPAFEDVEPPPPLITPPPEYNDIASPSSGLADYFSRLANTYDDDHTSDDSEGGSPRSTNRRGRVNVPLTPGARVNRSMDLGRNWVPVGR